ncbi:unnamed protein product [Ilex paraguariensis]|uniref:Aldose 1-epimerase n=1 Tax=Ilex paraguariensis TaxID=185542 RepID=A0ABC8R836_9AQUA
MKMSKISILFYFIIVAFAVVVNGTEVDKEVGIYELQKDEFLVKFTNWGASIMSVILPGRDGELAEVVLGYDSVKDYMNDSSYFGATVGRVANRIIGAQFTLFGVTYKLDANAGPNTLHGGLKGFNNVVWKVIDHQKDSESPRITFSYGSADGEEGFPGDLHVTMTYVLSGFYNLQVIMEAMALHKATLVSLAQHTYWNLGGHISGDILSEEVQIFASNNTPIIKAIPIGEIVSVKCDFWGITTLYDFLDPQTIDSKIKDLPNGYDINYVIDDDKGEKIKLVAMVHDKKSGRVMKLLSNAPGVQFYTGNWIKNVKGKGGYVYQAHASLCLETQEFPDFVNHPNFPSHVVPGKPYKHVMLYEFSINAQ